MKQLPLILLCAVFAGCSSSSLPLQSAPPRIKPELMLVLPEDSAPDLASAPRSDLPDAGAVLIAPDVIAYPIASREDPQHRDILYAGTWAYRRTSPRWRLQTGPSQDVLVGPITRDERRQVAPVQNQEIDTFLLEQRTFNDQNRQAITRLVRLQQDLQNQVGELRQAGRTRTTEESPTKLDDPSEMQAIEPKKASPNGETRKLRDSSVLMPTPTP